MAKPRLNKLQRNWLNNFLAQYPYYKLERIVEGKDCDRILFLEGTETLALPLIPEYEGASPGYPYAYSTSQNPQVR